MPETNVYGLYDFASLLRKRVRAVAAPPKHFQNGGDFLVAGELENFAEMIRWFTDHLIEFFAQKLHARIKAVALYDCCHEDKDG